MKFINEIKIFINNAGYDKLFLTMLPGFLAIVSASNIFTFDIINGFFIIISILFFQLSSKIIDDFIDWINLIPKELANIEKIGIRGRFDKCSYYIKDNKNPKLYFYWAIVLILIALSIFTFVSFHNNFKMFLPLCFAIILLYINYGEKAKKIRTVISSETIIAMLCAPITMISIFYASTRCITFNLVFLSIIIYFFIFNICYTSSLLNLKIDMMTGKFTFPCIIKSQKYIIYFTIFFNFFPYLLTYLGIIFNILPKYAYLTFLLIPHTIWLTYLCILYIIKPQKLVKWHFLMGMDKYKIKNEQEGLSWYTTRYYLARNIFFIYVLILILSFLITFN